MALEAFGELMQRKRHVSLRWQLLQSALMLASITAIELKENISDGLDKTRSL